MDWNLAIEKNREALKRILVMLVAMADGVQGDSDLLGRVRPTLPRHLHRFVLRLLRPAEAAARRLIIVAARGLVVELSSPRQRKPKPIFVHNGVGTGIVLRPGMIPDSALVPPRPALRALSLPLLDPLKNWDVRRRPKQRSVPRITFDFDRPREPDPPPPSPDDPLDAGRLHRRLEAVASALDDLPHAAKRLARWQARRDAGRDAVGAQNMNNDAVGAQNMKNTATTPKARKKGKPARKARIATPQARKRKTDFSVSRRCGPAGRPDGAAGPPMWWTRS